MIGGSSVDFVRKTRDSWIQHQKPNSGDLLAADMVRDPGILGFQHQKPVEDFSHNQAIPYRSLQNEGAGFRRTPRRKQVVHRYDLLLKIHLRSCEMPYLPLILIRILKMPLYLVFLLLKLILQACTRMGFSLIRIYVGTQWELIFQVLALQSSSD